MTRIARIGLLFLPLLAATGGGSAESWTYSPLSETAGTPPAAMSFRGIAPSALIQPEWVRSTSAPMLSSLTFADLDGDGVKDVIATTYGKGPNPYASGWIYVWDTSGSDLPGWPIETNTGPIPSTPAIGDVDGDGDMELVVGNWSQVWVWNHDGTVYPGWPLPYGGYNSVTLEDLDDDGDREIIYPSGGQLWVLQHNGSILPGFPVSVPHDDVGPPSVADIDGDSLLEIVAGINRGPVSPGAFEVYAWDPDGSLLPGFPVQTCGIVKGTPALGDLEGDGTVEIVVGAYHSSNYDSLYVWDSQGNLRPGWPVEAPCCRLSPPALGDFDGDGDLEIVVGGWTPSPPYTGQIYAFHHDGSSVQNWPVEVESGINSSPVIADADGDTSQVEVIVKIQNYICAIHSDGSPVVGFPYLLHDSSHSGTTSPTPVVGDMDSDGDIELCFGSSYGEVHFFDEPDAYWHSHEHWPMYKHDQWNTGFYPREGVPGMEEKPEAGSKKRHLGSLQVCPNPFGAGGTTISFNVERLTCNVSLRIYDLAGRLVRTLTYNDRISGFPPEADSAPKAHAPQAQPQANQFPVSVIWDGRDARGREAPGGVYLLSLTCGRRGEAVSAVLLR